VAEWLDARDQSSWDAFVAGHPRGSLFHLGGWRAAIESAFPHVRGQVLAVRAGTRGPIVGGLAAYSVRSWLLGRRIVSVPFASIVEPIVDDPAHLELLLAALSRRTKEQRAKYYECRFRQAPPETVVRGADVSRVAMHHFLPLGGPRADGASLECRFEASVRKKIKQSQRANVTVRTAASTADWEMFAGLYAATRRRLCLPAMSRAFFEALQRHLPACAELSLAEQDGRTLGALLALQFNGLYLVEWIGDTLEGRAIGVNQRLYWDAIQRARALACHTFSFGRTDAGNQGLRDFKQRWGTIEEDIPCVFRLADGGSHVIAPADPRSRGRMAAQLALGRAPAWAYGWLSDFCYRHLG
jgi:hypothetical protein